MAATVEIRQLSGTAPGEASSADKTSLTVRFQRSDVTTTTNAFPIPVPTSGQSYSMRVVLRPRIASGTFSQITSPVWYSDGTNSFGSFRKLWYQMSGSYTQPSIPTESNDPPQLSGAMTDWFATNSGSPADGDAITNLGPFTTTGYFGDCLNLVFEVEAGSPSGTPGGESITFAWSEI